MFIFPINSFADKWYNNWSINGIPIKKITRASNKECWKMAGGFATSMLIHWAGHIAFLELKNKPWHQNGLFCEISDGYMTNSNSAMFGRAGFIAQLSVGTLGKIFGDGNSFFWTGYHSGSFLEISTYPLRLHNKGDLYLISKNSNRDLEYGIYTIYSTYLLFENNFKKGE